ncbi:MAG: site-specific integrase [Oscillospiraceae bacterium]|nr:site-specific integrase [Oscillospiraceae bacterium]
MTGSLQLKRGIWQCVLNFRDNDGKRKQKWVSTELPERGNKKKAEAILKGLINEYGDNNYIEPTKMLFCDFVSEWVKASKSHVQPTTYDNYVHMLEKHVYPYFKALGITLIQVKPLHIQQYHSAKAEEGLSPNTIIKHHAIIRTSLKTAIKQGIIRENAADLVDRPKRKRFTAEFYNKDEINQLLNVIKDTAIETPVLMASYFGFRRSEVIGLKWDCIDFANKTLSVRHKVVRAKVNGKLTIVQTDDLKTDTSYRTLPLSTDMLDRLTALKQQQERNRQLFGNGYIAEFSDYVCVNEIGDLLKPDYVSDKFGKIIDKAGLKHIRFHDLRHSCASLLLSLGYSMKDIQEWLGHSNFQTTANLYAHVDPNNKRSMANGIASALAI